MQMRCHAVHAPRTIPLSYELGWPREITAATAKYVDQCAVNAAIEGRVLVLDGIEKVTEDHTLHTDVYAAHCTLHPAALTWTGGWL